MQTPFHIPKKNPTDYLKWLLFTLMGLMTLAVIYKTFLFYSHESPGRTRILSMSDLLYPHILCSAIAFLVGPLQFSVRLRNRNVRLHRVLVRLYAGSILLGSTLALTLSFIYSSLTDPFTFQGVIVAMLWLLTTTLGWLTGPQPTNWLTQSLDGMARSYGVTFTAVVTRFLRLIPFLSK